ncbi:hypothetical protein [Actinokineospora sp.]|uniref:hypothetical protein n=1 Tax=Actinokineospora sp. TaxID=1872133 RepID=UPI0040376BAA
MSAVPLLTHHYNPTHTCARCGQDAHDWGEPDDEDFAAAVLRRWWCFCPQCPQCPAFATAVIPRESRHGQG